MPGLDPDINKRLLTMPVASTTLSHFLTSMLGKWQLREGRSIDLPTSLTTCGHSLVDGLGAIRQRPKMLRIRRDLTLSSLPHFQLYWRGFHCPCMR
ncbi:hypothetical protein DPMN_114366 [Dreissena polymorpha]|uniref:Uncharacterized protein n=1 Tax=Dreissena polymorpha TaxID=45954 RepID=A0A9D4KJB1_DREPO|nr:hypothetical protein DPMN_114366 [Dreissena polymorpha]